MQVKEIKCKSIISDSGIYGVDYSVNPYVGCGHGCNYCYAAFMKKFTGHSEPWGEFVDVKRDSRSVLERDLMKKQKGSILLSSTTDSYQPIEKEYELARKILSRLADTKFPVSVLTKSDLLLRDLDVLKEFNPERISIGFTINFLEDEDRKIWEPNSPKISERIDALKKISGSGIECYVHVGPYFEGITELGEIAEEVEKYVTELQVENINFKYRGESIVETIRENYPNLTHKYEDIKKDSLAYKRRLVDRVGELREITGLPISLFLD